MQWESVYPAAYAVGNVLQHRNPAAPQHCNPTAPHPCSTVALQHRSPTAPQSCSTAILQPRSPPAAQQPRVTPDALHKATRARCGTAHQRAKPHRPPGVWPGRRNAAARRPRRVPAAAAHPAPRGCVPQCEGGTGSCVRGACLQVQVRQSYLCITIYWSL